MTKSWASAEKCESELRTGRAVLSCDTDYPSISIERDIGFHQSKYCKKSPTFCPNCKVKVSRFDLEAHIDDCPESPIPCLAGLYGCHLVVRRKELAAHAPSCALAKLALFLKSQNERLRMSFGAPPISFKIFPGLFFPRNGLRCNLYPKVHTLTTILITESHEAALEHLKRRNAILEGSPASIQQKLTPSTNVIDKPPSTTPTTDGGPFDSTTHHFLCLHESLREGINGVSTMMSELDAQASMMVMNESLRVKEEFALANSAIGSLRMQLHWLTSAQLQNQQRG